MKILMLLADGFEDTEALATRDVLIRSGLEVDTCSIKETNLVKSSFGLTICADILIDSVSVDNYVGIVLPGGKVGVDNLFNSKEVETIVKEFYNKNKKICAICAAPSILGRYGLLKNVNFTCYSGFEVGYEGKYKGSEVEVDGNFITSRSMAYSQEFGITIIKEILGKEIANKVEKGICSL